MAEQLWYYVDVFIRRDMTFVRRFWGTSPDAAERAAMCAGYRRRDTLYLLRP